MNRYIKGAVLTLVTTVTLTGCNDFLDEMPDNRTTLDSEAIRICSEQMPC